MAKEKGTKGASYIIQMDKELGNEAKVILIGLEKKNDSMLLVTSNILTLPATDSTGMLTEYYSLANVYAA